MKPSLSFLTGIILVLLFSEVAIAQKVSKSTVEKQKVDSLLAINFTKLKEITKQNEEERDYYFLKDDLSIFVSLFQYSFNFNYPYISYGDAYKFGYKDVEKWEEKVYKCRNKITMDFIRKGYDIFKSMTYTDADSLKMKYEKLDELIEEAGINDCNS